MTRIDPNAVKQMIRNGSLLKRKEEPTDEQVDEILETEIELPELHVTETWKEHNPGIDPMTAINKAVLDVLLEKQDRRVTIVQSLCENTDSTKCYTCAFRLPVPPNIIRGLVELQDDIEVYQCGNEIVLVSDTHWKNEALSKFKSLSAEARVIIYRIYGDLTEKLKKLPNTKYHFEPTGIKVECNGVDLSEYYNPSALVSSHIAAQAAGHMLELNFHTIPGSIRAANVRIVLPEISGNLTLQVLAERFNEIARPFRAQLDEHNLVAAFFAPSINHDGLDIVNVTPNGNGGYVNLSRDLCLYLYGKDLLQPVFKLEHDLMMLSIEDIDAFAVADCAAWIDYSEFK